MSLFSKKDKSEQKDASDIKQATISDTQMNSMQNNNTGNNNNNLSNNQMPSASLDTNNMQQSNQSFVNPFSGQSSGGQGSGQNPFGQQSQQNSNNSQGMDMGGIQGSSGQQNPNQNPFSQQGQQGMQQNSSQNDPMSSIMSMQTGQDNVMDSDKIQEMIDETVEKVIEDKWNMLEDKVNKVLRWKESKDAEINMLKEDLVSLADGFNKLEMKLINKISNYDKNILDVNSEIKALEKVFQKVTPTLINNVNELSKIADEFRGVKPKDRKVITEDDFAIDEEPVAKNRNN